jgi:hypothetical protein
MGAKRKRTRKGSKPNSGGMLLSKHMVHKSQKAYSRQAIKLRDKKGKEI